MPGAPLSGGSSGFIGTGSFLSTVGYCSTGPMEPRDIKYRCFSRLVSKSADRLWSGTTNVSELADKCGRSVQEEDVVEDSTGVGLRQLHTRNGD